MGRQSSRIYYQECDHKDIYFQGNYHKAMYLGNELIWEKKGYHYIGRIWVEFEPYTFKQGYPDCENKMASKLEFTFYSKSEHPFIVANFYSQLCEGYIYEYSADKISCFIYCDTDNSNTIYAQRRFYDDNGLMLCDYRTSVLSE